MRRDGQPRITHTGEYEYVTRDARLMLPTSLFLESINGTELPRCYEFFSNAENFEILRIFQHFKYFSVRLQRSDFASIRLTL